jgi:hypothetical protein
MDLCSVPRQFSLYILCKCLVLSGDTALPLYIPTTWAGFSLTASSMLSNIILVGNFSLSGYSPEIIYFEFTGGFKTDLLDTDKALTSLYNACVVAGPSKCAIYENNTELVRARVNKILNDVHLAPVSVYNNTDASQITFGVVDYSLAVSQIVQTLYWPYATGPILAKSLVELERGNGNPIYANSITSTIDSLALDTCQNNQPFQAGNVDVAAPIFCGDALVNTTRSLEEAYADYLAVLQVSKFISAYYTRLPAVCTCVASS